MIASRARVSSLAGLFRIVAVFGLSATAACTISIDPAKTTRNSRPVPPPSKAEMAWEDWYEVPRDHVALTGDRPLAVDGAPTLPRYADNIELLTGQVIRFRMSHRLEGVERTGTAVGISWGADVGGSWIELVGLAPGRLQLRLTHPEGKIQRISLITRRSAGALQ